jgi:hypothetical protein
MYKNVISHGKITFPGGIQSKPNSKCFTSFIDRITVELYFLITFAAQKHDISLFCIRFILRNGKLCYCYIKKKVRNFYPIAKIWRAVKYFAIIYFFFYSLRKCK